MLLWLTSMSPKSAKDVFRLSCTQFCTLGLKPPESLGDEGLIALIQSALVLGAQHECYGRLDAHKLVPCPNTVSKMITEEAKKAPEERGREGCRPGRQGASVCGNM
jgi:hypothetical protein